MMFGQFHPVLYTPCLHLGSEVCSLQKAKARRRHDEGTTKAGRIHVCYNDTEKSKNNGATFEKKKWQ
jgi:hypothetical protein